MESHRILKHISKAVCDKKKKKNLKFLNYVLFACVNI